MTDDALPLILADLETTVARQIEAGEAMDDKASSILRFNALYLGLGLTAVRLRFPEGFRLGGRRHGPIWREVWPSASYWGPSAPASSPMR